MKALKWEEENVLQALTKQAWKRRRDYRCFIIQFYCCPFNSGYNRKFQDPLQREVDKEISEMSRRNKSWRQTLYD